MIKIKNINTYKLYFYLGLFLKISMCSLFLSPVLLELFMPFLNYFIDSNFRNPYEQFMNLDLAHSFPYPSLMLVLMILPKVLFGWLMPNNLAWSLFLYKLPLLVADIGIFLILKNWLKEKNNLRLVWFYWFSPVLMYINYIHGQLDVIPIALLFFSLFFLFKNQLLYSAIILGLSLSAKTHIVLVYPFLLIFLFSRNTQTKKLLLFFTIPVLTFFLINLAYIFDVSFLKMIFFNSEQAKLFNASIHLNSVTFYLIPSALIILFSRSIFIQNYSRDLFIMFLGFVFSIILIFIPPMQGWYYWLIPFLVYFYVREKSVSSLIFTALSIFYLLYFLVINHSDYWIFFSLGNDIFPNKKTLYYYLETIGLDANIIVNIAFTALQTSLVINCFWIYKKGFEIHRKHKIMSYPFLVGIGGNSGVGKTKISNALRSVFTHSNTTVLCGDAMHKWQRNNKEWNKFTHLNPKANFLHKEVNFLKKLTSGQTLYRREYDHKDGIFIKEKPVKPNNLIIFEGLHPFYLSAQLALYDLKIFIKPSPDLTHHWKIIRDKENRGYSKEKIIRSIKDRESDSKIYIETQANKSDILIEVLTEAKIKDVGNKKENINIYYTISLFNSVYVESILEGFEKIPSLTIFHEYKANGRQVITLKGDCEESHLINIVRNQITALEDLGITNSSWPAGLFGALIILLTHCIFEKSAYEK